DLAVAISDPVHDTVIRPGYPGIPGAQFNRVEVFAKEFAAPAWIWVSARQWSTPAYLPAEPDDPREIGRYRIAARVGANPAGQRFAGSGRDGSPLAIRRYRQELFTDADVRDRFAAAVAAASIARGPHVTVVADSDTGCASPWVARTLVRGPSLGAT